MVCAGLEGFSTSPTTSHDLACSIGVDMGEVEVWEEVEVEEKGRRRKGTNDPPEQRRSAVNDAVMETALMARAVHTTTAGSD